MLPKFQEALQRNGFAIIKEDVEGQESRVAIARYGQLLTLPGLTEVQSLQLRDKENSTPNTYSGNYGRAQFPLHTDLAHWSIPPRYLVLRCIIGAKDVPTRLIDGLDLIQAIGELKMSRAIMQPRRPISGRISLLRLLDTHARGNVLRWDDLFIVPVTAEARGVCEAVKHHLAEVRAKEVTLTKLGDTLILDNWRMLHGRAAASEMTKRRLDRGYIDELTGE